MQSCTLEDYGETSEATTTVDAALQKGDVKDWLTVEFTLHSDFLPPTKNPAFKLSTCG